ncbi:hypothetical protein Taro_040812 [Colocasia esculenta]|uniref:RRM domain-containing protein n=1 Tax=Colocasia esculenta TaxID=4460 RepID=A0A843WJY2_COLES|nr:hypothetical protein [Colocasia esculenta]
MFCESFSQGSRQRSRRGWERRSRDLQSRSEPKKNVSTEGRPRLGPSLANLGLPTVHGEIEEGAVITDKTSGKSRGYGFVTYRHMESTQRALKESSKLIDGRLAVCNLACEGLSSTSVTTDQTLRKLYIGGLPPDVSTEMLLNFFVRHGEIEEGSVAYDKETNKSRGFGFVTYKTVEAAKKALSDPDKNLGGRNINVKLADSHKGRVAQPQMPAAVVPVAIPVPTPYLQPGKTHASATSVGYGSYSQPVAYHNVYPHTSSQYPPQPQISYPAVAANKDLVGFPAGASGNPYYSGRPWFDQTLNLHTEVLLPCSLYCPGFRKTLLMVWARLLPSESVPPENPTAQKPCFLLLPVPQYYLPLPLLRLREPCLGEELYTRNLDKVTPVAASISGQFPPPAKASSSAMEKGRETRRNGSR